MLTKKWSVGPDQGHKYMKEYLEGFGSQASPHFHVEKRGRQFPFELTVNDSLGLCCTDLQLLTAS